MASIDPPLANAPKERGELTEEIYLMIIKHCLETEEGIDPKEPIPNSRLHSASYEDLRSFQSVGPVMAAQVERYLRSLRSLTLEIVPGPMRVANYLHYLWYPPKTAFERTVSVQEAVSLEDIGRDFGKIKAGLDDYNDHRNQFMNHDRRTASLYHKLPKGPVFRLTTKQLPAFLDLLENSLKSAEGEAPSLQLKSLSFAFLYNHPHILFTSLNEYIVARFKHITKEMNLLFRLLDLLPNLTHLWLTLTLYIPQTKFLNQLIDYLVQDRYKAQLESLDLNLLDGPCTRTDVKVPVKYHRLKPLLAAANLVHFGLTDELTEKAALALLAAAATSSQLTSLKLNLSACTAFGLSRCSLFSYNEKKEGGGNVSINNDQSLKKKGEVAKAPPPPPPPALLSSVTSLTVIGKQEVRELFLEHFTSLKRLVLADSTNFNYNQQHNAPLEEMEANEFLLIGLQNSLSNLTLVNFNLPLLSRSQVLPFPQQITSLTVVSGFRGTGFLHFFLPFLNKPSSKMSPSPSMFPLLEKLTLFGVMDTSMSTSELNQKMIKVMQAKFSHRREQLQVALAPSDTARQPPNLRYGQKIHRSSAYRSIRPVIPPRELDIGCTCDHADTDDSEDDADTNKDSEDASSKLKPKSLSSLPPPSSASDQDKDTSDSQRRQNDPNATQLPCPVHHEEEEEEEETEEEIEDEAEEK